ncbi:MAG: RidA family protein [Leptospiraceae bacterium]|nr:RidA family protein [Leptospiraceae bacterium]MCK6382007.1 RidA family protein [Leptospiraceae bacterium]NUM40378.1 RidA family protein [Leptospiraceae bacterium]
MTPLEKLKSLKLELPTPPKAIAAYIPAKSSDKLIFTSGQLPMKDGKLKFTGKLGKEVDLEMGKECAKIACLNGLSAISGVLGGLDRISKIIKIGVYVASTPEFTDHHLVANSASELLVNIWGNLGNHARFAIGVPSLPLDAPVELEIIAEIR